MFYTPISPPGTARREARRAEALRRSRQARFAKLIDQCERDEIEAAVEGLIALLDLRDGDTDLEPEPVEANGDEGDYSAGVTLNPQPGLPTTFLRQEYRDAAIALADEDAEEGGDEQDHCNAEDDFVQHRADGPGCPIADPGGNHEVDMSDTAWIEWHTRSGAKVNLHGAEQLAHDKLGNPLHEDAEDDDPREANGDEQDGSRSEDDFMSHASVDAPGCPVSDPAEKTLPEGHTQGVNAFVDGDHEEGPAALAIRRPHRDRIRRDRCSVTVTRNRFNGVVYRDYLLRDGSRGIAFGMASELLPAEARP